MPTPGFPPHTLDDEGCPIWLTELAGNDPNHTLHVVRGLEPAAALEAVGAKPHLFRPCELPERKPDEQTSLTAAALEIDPGECAALLAGRVGEWTFVYEDAGATAGDETVPLSLSQDGRTAATATSTINADANLIYAVNGEELAWVDVDDLDLETDLVDLPDELRAAFEAAGVVEDDDLEPGEADYDITMRAICALAGLHITVEDLRRLPLLATPLG